ncbi:LysR family transcriptional regulator [Asanoa sp. WMMD1127]|uniref:LysR family transcriptional regulator n=1 Tax=Asanoa sp. WMMD1127 TaxID=3016107 RepID=UPI002415A8BB|nr:LysR family transcriptional regulator [Asanoa sp. WMMD1127]MDG4826806.1 LysR family transcriptional regulator [Asanoa sp. WMMD1127]
MELDLAQVRAFIAVARQLHFGRASSELFLTQQALSKRIQRLEAALGEQLLLRQHQRVQLTPAGERFLPHAQTLLDAARDAVDAVRQRPAPLRVDVWGPVHRPLRLVRQFADEQPGLLFELSMRRSLARALDALGRGELDAAFGRPHDLGRPWPDGLARRLVFVEPVAAAVMVGHPLADEPVLTARQLSGTGLWLPFDEQPAELLGLLRGYAAHLGIPVQTTSLNLGVEHTLDELRRHPHRVTPVGADWALPADIRMIPLSPVPYLPWSVVWRPDNRHPLLPHLLNRLAEQVAAEPVAIDPVKEWLPEPDLADLALAGR